MVGLEATKSTISVLEAAFVLTTWWSAEVGTWALVGYLVVSPEDVTVGPELGTSSAIYSPNVTLFR